MTVPAELIRKLRPFAKLSDEFTLIAPNRYAVPLKSQPISRKKLDRVGRANYTFLYATGTLSQKHFETATLSLPQALSGNYEKIREPGFTNFDDLRSQEIAIEFTLSAQEIETLKKFRALLGSRELGFRTNNRAETSIKLFCADDNNSHWYDPSYLKAGVKKIRTGSDAKKYLSADDRNHFSQFVRSRVNKAIFGYVDTKILKYLPVDDYDIYLGVSGVLEFIGLQSEVTYLAKATLT